MTRILFATSFAVLVWLTGCDSEPAAQPTPVTSTPVATGSQAPLEDTICTRMNASVVAKAFRATSATPMLGPAAGDEFPPLDSCLFELQSNSSNKRPYAVVGVSVLPATKADLAARRTAIDRKQAFDKSRPVAIGDGGFGSQRILLTLSHGRLVEVRGHTFGSVNSLAGNLATAREAIPHLRSLPPSVKVISQPECERGTAAATKLLGGQAQVRRDAPGSSTVDVACGWAGGSAMVRTSSYQFGTGAADLVSSHLRNPGAQPVAIGTGGVYDPATSLVLFRIGIKKLVWVDYDARAGQVNKADLIALARTIAPLYGT